MSKQRGIRIGEDPALRAGDDRGRKTEQAAGAGSQVDEARFLRQVARQGKKKGWIARPSIKPFAQREPIGGKP